MIPSDNDSAANLPQSESQISEGQECWETEDQRKRADGITEQDMQWIRNVVSGMSLKEGFGSRFRSERHRMGAISRCLASPRIAKRLVDELLINGDITRANEILGILAAQAAQRAIEKGDSRVVLAMLPKPQGKAPKASKVAPPARELEEGAGDITAKKRDSGQS